jgi:hypothetical protein
MAMRAKTVRAGLDFFQRLDRMRSKSAVVE